MWPGRDGVVGSTGSPRRKLGNANAKERKFKVIKDVRNKSLCKKAMMRCCEGATKVGKNE